MGFVSFCPLGGDCKKGGKRLGWDATESEARARISTHLRCSTHHELDEEVANEAAATADLVEEEKWIAPASDAGKGKAGKGGSSWRSEDWQSGGWGTGSWSSRASPYPEPQQSSRELARPAAPMPMTSREKIIAAIARAEAGTRAASRMARQAFQAFEDEANVLREALDAMRNAN